MIKVSTRFFKKNQNKFYEVGEEATFSKDEEEMIVNRGLAEYVKTLKTKEKKVNIKKK